MAILTKRSSNQYNRLVDRLFKLYTHCLYANMIGIVFNDAGNIRDKNIFSLVTQ